jgi:hypothetical protein
VISAYGPRESWYEHDDYEWVIYIDMELAPQNQFDMLQPFLLESNCVGLEYVGNGKGDQCGEVPQWIGIY